MKLTKQAKIQMGILPPPLSNRVLKFNGPCYDPRVDNDRLKHQLGRVYQVMSLGNWYTLDELEKYTGDPQASISAQLRHLRKPRFGGYIIEKRRRGNAESGLWEYRILQPKVECEQNGQLVLF